MSARKTFERCLVVELIGPAGAGKSTLISTVSQQDGTIGSLRVELQRHGPQMVRGLVCSLPALLGRAGRGGAGHADPLSRSVLRRLVGLPECRAILLDEGPVFRLTRERLRGSGKRSLSGTLAAGALRGWAKTVDFLLWLDAPDRVLMQRIRARGKSHAMKSASDAELYDFLARYRREYEAVVQEAARGCGTRVVRLDTGSDTAEQLARQVLSLLASERGGL